MNAKSVDTPKRQRRLAHIGEDLGRTINALGYLAMATGGSQPTDLRVIGPVALTEDTLPEVGAGLGRVWRELVDLLQANGGAV